MITLEQVKLLDTRVSKAVEYIKKVTDENALLKGKLDTYQKRIEELEVLVQRFREDQNRIEDGILSALDRLNQFEDALESKLSSIPAEVPASDKANPSKPVDPPDMNELPEESEPQMPAASDTAKTPEKPVNELDIF